MNTSKPKRILHIVGGMGIGGIETWIMNVYRNIDKSNIQFDFLVSTTALQEYDNEITQLGGRIFRSPRYGDIWKASQTLYRVIKKDGPFHAIHVHGRTMVGLQLLIARIAGVPNRIGHTHNINSHPKAKIMLNVWQTLMNFSTIINGHWFLGCSIAACDSVFGPNSTLRFKKVKFLPYGINLEIFKNQNEKAEIYKEFSLNNSIKIIGHIGSFRPEKNHLLLIDIFEALVTEHPEWKLLLIGGKGEPIELQVRKIVAEKNLVDKVVFVGQRTDIHRVASCFDVFIFPSYAEGFGLVVLETQTLGIPSVLSDKIPIETAVIKKLTHRVALNAPLNEWVDAIQIAYYDRMPSSEAWEHVNSSSFNIDICTKTLTTKYYNIP